MDLPGLAVFLQFKIVEQMRRGTAKEYASPGFPLSLPFYRMHLRNTARSDQHALLVKLEQSGGLVYYIAPGFDSIQLLNQYFSSLATIENSIYLKPSEIGDIDDAGEHSIAFQSASSAVVYRFSEMMVEIRRSSLDLFKQVAFAHRRTDLPLNAAVDNLLIGLESELRRRDLPLLPPDRVIGRPERAEERRHRSKLDDLAFYAQTYCDAGTLIVQQRPLR